MRGRVALFFVLLMGLGWLTGCQLFDRGQLQNVGLILEGTIHDETWGRNAYMGLLEIKDEYNVSILFRENVTDVREVEEIVDDFNRQGVNLIFGQGENFGRYFREINSYYPQVQFVYFNGSTHDHNITSIQFDQYNSYYYAGMLSAEITETDKIGVIATFYTATEMEGYFEGVRAIKPEVDIQMERIQSGYDQQNAIMAFHNMIEDGVDVIFPAGEGFNTPIIQLAKENDVYVLGYINDQYELAEDHILTSTVIQTEQIYLNIAEMFNNESLASGIINLGFMDENIYLGTFGDQVPSSVQFQLTERMNHFLETGERLYPPRK